MNVHGFSIVVFTLFVIRPLNGAGISKVYKDQDIRNPLNSRIKPNSSWNNLQDQQATKLGQVSGIGLDSKGNLHVFHRGERSWDESTFDEHGLYRRQKDGPIKASTHLVLDPSTGRILNSHGANRFYMPHGLTVDNDDNVWLTDVAMHQVFKVRPGEEQPILILGQPFKPGNDRSHFCKPTDVAVSKRGEIFVADGYCNSRIVKFSADGSYVNEFGNPTNGFYPAPPGTFQVPHSLTLIDDLNLLCVADRENGRIQCFGAGLNGNDKRSLPFGAFMKKAENLGRVFAIDNIDHFLIGVTNDGLTSSNRRLFTVDMETGESEVSEPGLINPHDIAASKDGTIFVAEIGPNRIVKLHI